MLPPIILKSDKLTTLQEDRNKLTVRAAVSRAEINRLNKILFQAQIQDATVVRTTETMVRVVELGRPLSFKISPGVIVTPDDEETTARNDDILKRTLAGESLEQKESDREKLEREHRQLSAIEHAIEHLDGEIYKEKTALAIRYCKTRVADHNAMMTRLYAALLETHSALSDLYALKQQLVDSGIGTRGICTTLPDSFLPAPGNPYSELADYFREGKRQGWVSKIPVEYAV
jgi:hypothetical protein